MTPQEKFISKFLLTILAVGLMVGDVRRTWFPETFDISESAEEADEVAKIAQERRTARLAGENIASIITIQKVNLNRALKSELITLPGIGPALADRIIAYRDEFGTFKTIDDLRNVKGVGDKSLEKIRLYFEL
tara:strand:+ start:191 stop:589 length:399 start_codon:yes stop_codon:yes gene_type:complete